MNNNWQEELPYYDLAWCFHGGPFNSNEKLYEALVKNTDDFEREDLEKLARWNPNCIVIDSPSVWIAYIKRDGSGDYIWSKFIADNIKNFSAIELLLKSHNYFVSDETPTNHNFLESIDFVTEHEDGSPMYCLSCSS